MQKLIEDKTLSQIRDNEIMKHMPGLMVQYSTKNISIVVQAQNLEPDLLDNGLDEIIKEPEPSIV
jgi:hypothetical protein